MKIIYLDYDNNINLDFDYLFVNNVNTFEERISQYKYDIIIINFDFFEIIVNYYDYLDSKILFLSAYIDETIYKKALQYGDFIYSYEELYKISYRIKYILIKEFNYKYIFKYKNLIYNFKNKILYRNSNIIYLTKAERELLELLINRRNNFVSKDDILLYCESIEKEATIKVIVYNLRKIGFKITNKKNIGYLLKEDH